MRNGIPGTVEDAIEIKRKCEPTCRARWPPRRVAFIRVLRIATCSRGFAAGSYANPCEIEFQSLAPRAKRVNRCAYLVVKQKEEKKKKKGARRHGLIV